MKFYLAAEFVLKTPTSRRSSRAYDYVLNWTWSAAAHSAGRERTFDWYQRVMNRDVPVFFALITVPDDFQTHLTSARSRISGWVMCLRDQYDLSGPSVHVIRSNEHYREYVAGLEARAQPEYTPSMVSHFAPAITRPETVMITMEDIIRSPGWRI